MEITQEQREALDSQHGGVVVLDTAFGDFAFRAINEVEYKKFNLGLEAGGEAKTEAYKVVCVSTLVWPVDGDGKPDKEALRQAIAKRPGLIHSIANQVMQHSGLSAEAARKK